MDPTLSVTFDGKPGMAFVQGEDRDFQLAIIDKTAGTPIDLSTAKLAIHLPRTESGTIKRYSYPLTIKASMVTPGTGVVYPDHGLVDGDPLDVVGSTLPAPLDGGGFYTVQYIDNDTFGFRDASTGAPIALTSAGSGSFTVDVSDIDLTSADAGLALFALRAHVSAAIAAGAAQAFEVLVNVGGKQRIVVFKTGLDVTAQPEP